MAEHHYLPTLKKSTNLIQPPVAGSWQTVSRREIEALSQGLEIGEGARKREATSLPDVWARPLLFHSAIRPHSDHPLRQQIIEEWRGLLSLIALSDYFGIKLELEPVVIDNRGGRFAKSLVELSPRSVSLEEGKSYDWLDVLLLRVDDVTVGALSPLTLVYTGVRNLPSTIPLVENGRLRPPTDASEIHYVAQWAQNLKSRLDGLLWADQQRNTDYAVVEDINTLLRTWLGSLRSSLGLTPNEPLEQPGVDFAIAEPANATWPRLHVYAVYRELLRYAKITTVERKSDVLLKHTRGDQDRSFVIIASELISRDIKIWGTLKSKDLGALEDPGAAIGRYFKTETGDRIERHNLAAANAVWIRPEKYFLSETLLVSPSDAPLLSDSDVIIKQKNRGAIYPFRKEILQFYSPEEIAERLAPRFENIDGGLRFIFTLPLDSPVAPSVEVHKDYRYKEPKPEDGVIRRFDPSPVYVFPRYRTPHWRRYFVFSAGNTATIEPFTTPGAAVKSVVRKRQGSTIHQLSGDSSYPEALGLSLDDGKAAGLVLLGKAAEQPGLVGNTEMIIGIDYGTSNTNVFIRPPDANQPQPWSFDLAALIQPVFAASSPTRTLQDQFLPTKISMPIATNLRIFDPAMVDQMLLDYFIYFSDADDFRVPENVSSDIKWQDIIKSQQFIKSMMMLLLLYVAEERAKRFRIIFSYPRAFSTNQRQRLEQTWEGAIKELTRDGDRLLNVADGLDVDVLKPLFGGLENTVEAIAAGEFFASRNEEGKYEKITIQDPYDRASVETTAVCIDVGGGTTDICIWHANRRVLDSSVLLAGRQIGSWIRGNAAVRELLFSRDAALALKEVESKPTMFSARLNQILQQQEEEITKNLIMHGTHPEIDRLRRMLALEFGAIVFYTATLLVAANRLERAKGNIASDISGDGINLHWGGNAAKMVRWIDYGKFSADGIAARILRAVLRNALADAEINSPATGVSNKQSPGHKSEVAGGLIVWNNVKKLHTGGDQAMNFGDDDDPEMIKPGTQTGGIVRNDADMIIMGDGIETTDGSIAYDQPVPVSHLFPSSGGTIVRSVSMERLGRFLEIINHIGLRSGLIDEGKQVQLNEQLRTHVGRQVRGEFVTMASLDPAKRVVEPAFISEVKALLEVLSQQP